MIKIGWLPNLPFQRASRFGKGHHLEDPMNTALTRLERIAASLDPRVIAEIRQLPGTKEASHQPWFIAGVSDGMGLHTAIAAIEAGAMKRCVGVYWEPAHLLERNAEGVPVSAIHRARVEHANALVEFARRRGVAFQTVFSNCILAPERDLKGHPRGDVGHLPEEILTALGPPTQDLVFINSVAFGKWMCPREGGEPRRAPVLGFDGSLSWGTTKPYHARGYQETLDTMGRNHAWMLDALQTQGYMGPKSLSAFFTWAGGSQRVSSLEGIYGKGALGDAKLLAEADIVRRRLEEGGRFGKHAVVRLPAFLSAALMGIPGGGFFGMISRRILEQNQCFEGMPELAGRMIREFFGNEWISENPISQIELDHAECLHIDTINAAVAEGTCRLEAVDESLLPVLATEVAKRFGDLFPPRGDVLLRAMIPGEPQTVEPLQLGADVFRKGLPETLGSWARSTVVWGDDVEGILTCQVSRFADGIVVEGFRDGRWVMTATGSDTTFDVRPEELGQPSAVVAPTLESLPEELQGLVASAQFMTFEWSTELPEKALLYLQSTAQTTALTWVADAKPCGRVTLSR